MTKSVEDDLKRLLKSSDSPSGDVMDTTSAIRKYSGLYAVSLGLNNCSLESQPNSASERLPLLCLLS